MHIKPKEIQVNLPIVLQFEDAQEIPQFAASINTIIHGKIKVKCEELGLLAGKYMGIFYLHRNDEYMELRTEFKTMIEQEEIERYTQ